MMEERKTGSGPMGVEDYKRTMRALGRQIDDPEALAQALTVLETLKGEIANAVVRLRNEDGYSTADIARALKVSRQAVAQRWKI